jgi:hypothetical protein
MNNSLKKIKATLESTPESSKLLSENDRITLIQAKESKNVFSKQVESNFAPRQADRDWWWCDDV